VQRLIPSAPQGDIETRDAGVGVVEELSLLLQRKSPDEIGDALADWLGRIEIELLRSR
jgi:hypothetical protein